MTTSTQNSTSSSNPVCRCDRNCGCCTKRKTVPAAKSGFFRKRPWLWVVLAFALLLTAWTTFFYIAYHNQPQVIVIGH